MRGPGVRAIVCCGALALVAASRGAAAQPADDAARREAREIGYAGVEAYQAGDYVTARERLDRAYELLRVPSLGLWSARALAKLGKLVEASARYLEVAGLPSSVGDEAVQREARADAERERAALAPRIPRLAVRVVGAPTGEATITIDDAVITSWRGSEGHPVNPGRHRIEAASGEARAEGEVIVAEGERRQVALRFAGASAEGAAAGGSANAGAANWGAGAASGGEAGGEPAATVARAPELRREPGSSTGGGGTLRTLGWAGVIGGGGALAVGAIAGAIAISRRGTLDGSHQCSGGGTCNPTEQSAVDGYNGMVTLSTVGIYAGGALAAAGLVLLLTNPPEKDTGAAAGDGRAGAASPAPRPTQLRFALYPGAGAAGGGWGAAIGGAF